jgi:aminoglycoside phosphotransferase family enzyme/predicted kinase
MSMTALPPVITALLDPRTHASRPDEVSLLQTHISYVCIAGDEVYKVKKPVKFSFLDFSTLERRRHFCHEEVRLNRRLACDTYLGVVALCPAGGSFRLAAATDAAATDAGAVEYAVHMRRLPADRILAHLLDSGQATAVMIDAVAERMAAFHASADAGPEVSANGSVDTIWAIMRDNFGGVQPFRGRSVDPAVDDAIQSACRAFLERETSLFARRQRQQRIRDCHGDLHAEHIVLTDPIVIFDCIEFNATFRHCDVASEMAFLAMDLDYHGHPELSRRLLQRYAALAADQDLLRLAPFYQCHRAYVRGKVESLKSAEPEVAADERAAACERARRYFALAERYTWRFRPALAVVFGLSGSGKSTVAAELARRTGWTHLNSDVVRKELAGLPPTTRGSADLYRPERSAETYATMLARAGTLLTEGDGAIVDATFQQRAHRDHVRALAARHAAAVLFVECDTSEDVIRHRLAQRRDDPMQPSDADWAVYREQRLRYEPYGKQEADPHLRIDTAQPIGTIVETIVSALQALLRRS